MSQGTILVTLFFQFWNYENTDTGQRTTRQHGPQLKTEFIL